MSEAEVNVSGKPDLSKIYAALSKAQAEFQAIAKNKTVQIRSEKGSYTFRYADLEELINKTRPALTKYGLAVVQSIGNSSTGKMTLDLVIGHESGVALHSSLNLPDVNELRDPKQFGAIVTYLRRYQYSAMLCLAADDDLDDDGEETPPLVSPPQSSRPERLPTKSSDPKLVGTGEVAWLKKKLDAAGISHEEELERLGLSMFEEMDMGTFAVVKARLMNAKA